MARTYPVVRTTRFEPTGDAATRAAAKLRGMSPAAWLREVALRAAAEDLRAAAERVAGREVTITE
jgi:hypothetical protein